MYIVKCEISESAQVQTLLQNKIWFDSYQHGVFATKQHTMSTTTTTSAICINYPQIFTLGVAILEHNLGTFYDNLHKINWFL